MRKVISKLSRRSFFGAAAGAAAAGPLAVEAVAKDIQGRALVYGGCDTLPSASVGSGSYVDHLKSCLVKLKVEDVAASSVQRLDPDLIANRSLSLNSRLRIQAERDTARVYRERKAHLLREIAEYS